MKYHTTHSITISANAESVFTLLGDVNIWPEMLDPCKNAEIIKKDRFKEIVELTASVNGIEMTWQSEREIFRDIQCIKSNIFKPMEPAEKMCATWQVYPQNKKQCLVVLNHDYDIKADVRGLIPNIESESDARKFLEKAINANSKTELENIKYYAEAQAAKVLVETEGHYSYFKICPVPSYKAYQFLRNTVHWTTLFNNCEKTKILKQCQESETIKVWGYQEGRLIDWITKRSYMDSCYRINYIFEKQMPLLDDMHGEWQVIPLGEERCIMAVNRFWRLKEDVKNLEQAERIMLDFVSANTENEFEAIVAAILGREKKNILIRSVHIPFEAKQVYRFMSDLNKWKEHIPHCKTVDIIYDDGIHQMFTMEAMDQKEEFKSIRQCCEPELKITYFQSVPPSLLKYHTGEWIFNVDGTGTSVVFKHEFIINEEVCTRCFNSNNTLDSIKIIEGELTKNSLATLESCKQFLEKKG